MPVFIELNQLGGAAGVAVKIFTPDMAPKAMTQNPILLKAWATKMHSVHAPMVRVANSAALKRVVALTAVIWKSKPRGSNAASGD